MDDGITNNDLEQALDEVLNQLKTSKKEKEILIKSQFLNSL